MEKQVQVVIKLKESTAILETQHGLQWSFKCPKSSTARGENFTAVSSLASALLTATISKWLERSMADGVCFTLTAKDVFQAERNID